MLELDIATVLFQVLNFVVLLFLLYRFLFKPLRKSLDQRAKVIADTVQKARDEESEAEELRTLWEERVRQVELQAEETLRAAEAEAYEQSQMLRGEGDATATEIYAAAYTQDPEFFSFLRSLLAYEAFLVGETTLVLDSDSNLFRYLANPGSGE